MPPGKWVGHAHCYKNLIIARRRQRRRPVRCVSCETGWAARHEDETLNAREMDRSVCTLEKKSFMEREMTSILVQGVGPEQEKLLNSSKTSKTLEIYYMY